MSERPVPMRTTIGAETRPKKTRHRAAILGIVAVVLGSACAVNGLSFVTDTRVKILTPEANEETGLPLIVTWTVEDFDGYFAVFFDRSPMGPNQSMRTVVPEDDPCLAEPSCPDANWLADRNIYVTDSTSLGVEHLPDRRDTDRTKDRHDVTIVLLDQDGRRSGESAFTREFIVERDS